MKRVRIPLLLAAAAAFLAFGPVPSYADAGGAQAMASQEGGAAQATYVGSETCVTCHSDKGDQLATTPHGSKAFGDLSSHGCETCHGPGSLHVDDPDVKANQPSLMKLTAEERDAVCQKCHDGGAQFFWQSSTHNARGVSCTDCHSIHSAKGPKRLKQATVMDTCVTCHKDIRAQLYKTSHHPIREGQITCTDCHNPHGSSNEKMIKTASVNDLCYTCHTEKRGPFLWDHAPVRENCLTCHTPHGSNHIKLQKTSVPFLCQQCHSNTRHPGTLYDAQDFANGATPNNRAFNRACLNCHSAIHGSNNPSSPYLGR